MAAALGERLETAQTSLDSDRRVRRLRRKSREWVEPPGAKRAAEQFSCRPRRLATTIQPRATLGLPAYFDASTETG
jgi:hypothetical protein